MEMVKPTGSKTTVAMTLQAGPEIDTNAKKTAHPTCELIW